MTDKLTTCITAFVWTPASIVVTNNIIPYTHTHKPMSVYATHYNYAVTKFLYQNHKMA
jgi:hypothetical protein